LRKKVIHLDPEWLCILKKTDHLLSIDNYSQGPIPQAENVELTEKDLKNIHEDFQSFFEVPLNFVRTAPAHDDASDTQHERNKIYLNEQTTLLCEMLSVRDPIRMILEKQGKQSMVSESATNLYNNILDEEDTG